MVFDSLTTASKKALDPSRIRAKRLWETRRGSFCLTFEAAGPD